MKVLVAGATGAIGRRLVRRLAAGGHEVVGMTRSAEKSEAIAALGATPAVADALDAGVRRFLAQSYAGWPYARSGGMVKDEEAPLDDEPPKSVSQTLAAIRHLERAVTGADWTEGIVLRYGGFYGPGTSMDSGGEQREAVRRRQFPVVGGGAGMISLIHVDDGAAATVAALERAAPGVYNIAEGPVAFAEFLPEVARQLGAKRPWRVPRWVGRLAAGEAATVMMTELRGASSAKAKRELGWAPAHSWRDSLVASA